MFQIRFDINRDDLYEGVNVGRPLREAFGAVREFKRQGFKVSNFEVVRINKKAKGPFFVPAPFFGPVEAPCHENCTGEPGHIPSDRW
jgi:hypothetical protein